MSARDVIRTHTAGIVLLVLLGAGLLVRITNRRVAQTNRGCPKRAVFARLGERCASRA